MAFVMGALILVAAIYIYVYVVFLVAAAMGIGGIESLILMSVVGILAVVGLFAGALLVWRKALNRRG